MRADPLLPLLASDQPSPATISGEVLSRLGDLAETGWLSLTEPQELRALGVWFEAPPLRLQPLELSAGMLSEGLTVADGRY